MNQSSVVTPIEHLSPWSHETAMEVATAETDRILDLVASLRPADWSRSTDCPGWTVRDVLAHLLGMWKLQADPDERSRQVSIASEQSQVSGRLRIDELTALQVSDQAHLSLDQLADALHDLASRALSARRDMPESFRATSYDPLIPGESGWTFGYLFDVVHTRDPWMHRIDICRAAALEPTLSADHDGRIVSDVVRDWWSRHEQPVTLILTGPAGGTFVAGDGPPLTVDAIEFCRILSGRADGDGLLGVPVTF